MGAIASLNAALRWELSDFDRGTAHIEGVFGKLRNMASDMGDAFVSFGQRMTLGITAPIGALALYTVNAASDVKEMQSAFDYTFGAMSGRMNKWADETGDAMGRASDEMKQGALAMGQMFTKAAPTEEAAARLSQKFAVLAQDAASFYNTDYDTALGKIRSGLAGESEPLRDFGVFLNEAAVEAKGLELGLMKTGQELNEMGKIMARAALISEGLADANGDVERTSTSFANRVRALRGDIHELAVELGQRFLPIAERMVGWAQAAAHWVGDLPEPVKRVAVGFAAFLAVIGPVSLALSALVLTVLPLFLARMGPVFLIVSAIINPIGTAIVILSKFAASWEVLGALLGRIAPLILRLGGPIGWAVALFVMFKDNLINAFRAIWSEASATLGPAFAQMLASLGQAASDLIALFSDLANSPIGQFLGECIELMGLLIECLLQLAGSGVIAAIEGVTGMVSGLGQIISGTVNVVRALIAGDWSKAWDLAVSTVGSAMIRIGEWIKWLAPGLSVMLKMLGGLMGGSTLEVKLPDMATTPTAGAPKSDDKKLFSGSGNYAEASITKPKRPTGPTAEELAWRKEDMRLQQAYEVARESGNQDEERSLRRQMDLRDQIQGYRRSGLSLAAATVAGEKDMLEIDEARAIAQAKAIATEERSIDIQLAEIRGDHEQLRLLEDQDYLEQQTLHWQRQKIDLLEAERLARLDLKNLEAARAEQSARRLADQARETELELARLRGDSATSIRAREEEIRRASRAQELRKDFRYSPDDAAAQAANESADRERAGLQGSVRDAFRNGVRAALDDNLGSFFETWMKDRAFNALTSVLDRLADRLADLLAGGSSSGGSGGLFGAIVGGISGMIGGGNGLGGVSATSMAHLDGVAAQLAIPRALPGFDTGGRFKIRGFPGIDRNILSVNNTPVARVGDGEILDIQRPAARNDNGGGMTVINHNDFRGASADAVAGIRAKIDQLDRSIEQRALSAYVDGRDRRFIRS